MLVLSTKLHGITTQKTLQYKPKLNLLHNETSTNSFTGFGGETDTQMGRRAQESHYAFAPFTLCKQQTRTLTIHVLDFSPMNESRSTWVSLLARNGRWAPFLPSALMHSFKARSDLLISAPSIPLSKQKRFGLMYTAHIQENYVTPLHCQISSRTVFLNRWAVAWYLAVRDSPGIDN